MALTNPTVLNTNSAASGGTSIASGTISPTGGGLLIVAGTMTIGSSVAVADFSVADTLTGTGTWTVHEGEVRSEAGGTAACCIATAKAGPTPGSGTVTLSWTGSVLRRTISVAETTGQHATAPVTQSQSNQGGASTLTVTLDSSPASDAIVFGAVSSYNDTAVTHDPAFTELVDTSVGTGPAGHIQTQYDNGGADTTVDWSGLTARNVGVAIEIAAAAAAGGATRALMYARRRGR